MRLAGGGIPGRYLCGTLGGINFGTALEVVPTTDSAFGSPACLLAEAGIGVVRETLANTPEAAAQAAQEMGFPVVLKIASPDILHKSDIGGVALGLRSTEDVRSAGAQILKPKNISHYGFGS